jgi:signal transduction histidine kinase
MGNKLSQGITKIEYLVSLLILLFLSPYTYAHFKVSPYLGMYVDPISGEIKGAINQGSSQEILYVGDQVIQVGSSAWKDFTKNIFNPGKEIVPGRQLPLTIRRGEQEFSTIWIVPGVTRQEQLARLTETWWLGYVFWIAGTLVILFIRPRHSRRMLLAVFLYLGAIWLTAGPVSAWGNGGIWRSSSILHSAFWILMPVSLHFHWTFPSPLARPPKFWWLIYVAGIGLAFAEWLHLLPQTAYLIGGLIATIGSVVLLFIHTLFQPKHRRDVIPLVILIGLALLPVIVVGVSTLINPFGFINNLVLITLLAIPFAYIFAVYRRQFGEMELRHNRIVSVVIFLTLLSIIFVTFGIFIESRYAYMNSAYWVALIIPSAVFSSIITLVLYSPFQRLIERYLIGIPYDTTHLIETYSARITTSLDKESLKHILTEEILPSLMIRQSVLYRLKGSIEIQKLFSIGITDDELPDSAAVKEILQVPLDKQNQTSRTNNDDPNNWIRLILPLTLENQLYGAWLLGRYDPDDFYSKSEIKILQSIADQTAIALTNIDQAEYLHALYQTNIDRHETERQKLALELHDQVLGQLALMIMNPKEEQQPDQLSEICTNIAASIRRMVDGLRPAMLNYGLCHAIEELCDNIYELSDNGMIIEIELPFTGIRYQPQSELHLYRIIQQACNNTLKHAQAHQISISGSIEPDFVNLVVKDDGIGFQFGQQLDLPELLSKRSFGIVGMYERASLIGAKLDIFSHPGLGTTVQINWNPKAAQIIYGEADSPAASDAK